MTDIVDSATRSRMMAGIQGKDTRPELVVRSFIHARGFRYRLHVRNLPGHPDIVLPKYNLAIFVHGCYWHRHIACKFATTPASNREFWLKKLCGNVERDKRNIERLAARGWRVIVIWECGLRGNEATVKLKWLPDHIRLGDKSVIEWPKIGAAGFIK